MIIDGRKMGSGSCIRTDVCIVGAGVAGVTLAREFIGRGFRVCLVEAGGLRPDRDTQSLFWGENVGHPYFPLDTARCCGFGGTGNRWSVEIGGDRLGVRLRPLDDIDFLEREWVPHSGWPFGKATLDPFYERAQAVCRVGPYRYDAEAWEDAAEGRRRLGLDGGIETVMFQFGSRDTFTRLYQKEITAADNIDLLIHANAIGIEMNAAGRRATGLLAGSLTGGRFRIEAKVFVLAMGAIEIPRLLLSSRKVWGSGIGNAHDLVGRFFMEHLHLWSGRLIPSSQDMAGSVGLYAMHSNNGVPVMGKLALAREILIRDRLLNYCVSIHPHRRGHPAVAPYWEVVSWPLLRSPSGAADGRTHDPGPSSGGSRPPAAPLKGLHRLHTAAVNRARMLGMTVSAAGRRRRQQTVFQLNHMTEQAPNPESRITLSEERDPLGRNRVRLDWRLSSIDISTIVRAQEIIDAELRRAGLGRLEIDLKGDTPPAGLEGGWHHMGTTRMHRDPARGVVDPDCLVHGTSNLYIAGPSVFPTCGYANPVLTIVALALRLADRLKQCVEDRDW